MKQEENNKMVTQEFVVTQEYVDESVRILLELGKPYQAAYEKKYLLTDGPDKMVMPFAAPYADLEPAYKRCLDEGKRIQELFPMEEYIKPHIKY